jgi:hypothetical protein
MVTAASEKELKPLVTRKEIVTTIPTLYEVQLTPAFPAEVGTIRSINLTDTYITALTGPRGGIKSGSLAYCAIKYMAAGLPAWTNMPVKCNLVRRDGSIELLESRDLDFEQLFKHAEEYHGGMVGIDEYQQWDRSGRAMTTQHLVLMGLWEQIRKLDLSFYYVAKRIDLVPGDIAWETDIELNCSDITPMPKSGEVCLWQIKDLSGLWTRQMFDPKNPIYYKHRFYHRAIWGAYDTRQKFDFYEAMRGVKMNLEKRVVGDGGSSGELDFDQIKRVTQEVFQSYDKIQPSQLWETLNIRNTRQMSRAKEYLQAELGLVTRITNGKAMLTMV